jgi:hypothetical protein
MLSRIPLLGQPHTTTPSCNESVCAKDGIQEVEYDFSSTFAAHKTKSASHLTLLTKVFRDLGSSLLSTLTPTHMEFTPWDVSIEQPF